MIVRGGARKDGLALADYLTSKAEKKNDHVTILEVRHGATQDIHKALFDMDISAELTQRGTKGLYQSTINPAYGEDRQMSRDDWFFSANTLEKELGFDGQNRVIVLHEKKGRVHAHVIWQREKDGKMISTSHNFKKHDIAREKIEVGLNQVRTLQPKDNKQALTNLWNSSKDAKEFMAKAEAMGFKIGRGERRAYVVQTPDGQKLDFVRQLQGIKTNQVKERFKDIENSLPNENELGGQERISSRENERLRRKEEAFIKRRPADQARIDTMAKMAGENFSDIAKEPAPEVKKETYTVSIQNIQYHFKPKTETKAKAAGENFKDIIQQQSDDDRRAKAAEELMKQLEEVRKKNRDPGRNL